MARSAATAARPSSSRRRPPARRMPRRLSGPTPTASGAVALPGRVLRGPIAQAAKARAGGVLDALLQGRAWIALVAVLLVGIVFFNVDLLELNRDIAHSSDKAARLGAENARLRLEVARLASSERIQKVAAKRGLELPAPGEVRYLRLHPGADARRAAARITAPGSGTAAPLTSGTPASAPSTPAPTATTPATTPTPATGTTPPTTTTPTGQPQQTQPQQTQQPQPQPQQTQPVQPAPTTPTGGAGTTGGAGG